MSNPAAKPLVRHIEHPGWTESHLSLPGGAGGLGDGLAALPGGATVVLADAFGSAGEISAIETACRASGILAPVTRVLSTASGCGGLQLVAASGCPVTRVEGGGFVVEGPEARHFFHGGIEPTNAAAPHEEQAESVFFQMERALDAAGMSFSDVVRTWFYNDRILDWYPGFNAVRTGYFRRHDIRRMPASTGIGAPNPRGSALVAKVLAVVRRASGAAAVRTVRSPLQCDAFAYGSAFSRAMAFEDSRTRTLHISGTASISPGGESAHPGDTAAQIRLTMDVVRAILGEAGMDFSDTVRSVAYFRNPSDIPLWGPQCGGFYAMPGVVLGCDVCRDDLLFEIELDAAIPITLSS
jgi:enamine deaminase RidA (YjgF/YER057c/UK114 family)